MLAILMLFACSTQTCDLDTEAWALVPADATDCGDDFDCFAVAFSSGEPAVVRTSSTGIDSMLTGAHVWTGDRYWMLSHDSYSPNRVDGRECLEPSVNNGEIVCSDTAPAGNHYAVCGTSRGSPAPLPFDP